MEKAFQVSILEKDETLRGIFPEIISGDQFHVNCFAEEDTLYAMTFVISVSLICVELVRHLFFRCSR